MKSLRGYEVEMSPEKALIIGDVAALIDPLVRKFEEFGIETHVFSAHKQSSIAHLLSQGDIDYCVVFGNDIPSTLQSSRVFVIAPLDKRGELPALPAGARVCYYGDYLGSSSSHAPLLERFLHEAARHKRLTIPGDGLDEYHLLHEQDLVIGLTKWIFSTKPVSELLLINPESISLLSLAYKVRSLLPYKIDIVFDESSVYSTPSVEWEEVGKYQNRIGWRPEHTIDQELPRYIDDFFARPQIGTPLSKEIAAPTPAQELHVKEIGGKELSRPKLTPLRKENRAVFVPIREPTRLKLRRPKLSKLHIPIPKPRLPAPARIAISSIVLGLSLYIFSILAALTITALTIRTIAQEGTVLSGSAARTARAPAVYLQANLTAITAVPGFNKIETLRTTNQLLTSYILGLKTLASVEKLGETSRGIAEYVLSEGEGDIASALSGARLEVDTLYSDLSLLDGSLPREPISIIPDRYHDGYGEVKTKLQEARRAALTAKSLLAAAPEILGVGSRRKYAILFQNNMELRATGGFIGSFGIVSLENGKLFDIQIYDVYSADGQLKGHVDPPEEIRKYLGEVNWYLRDSNWDPDFPTSARRAEWFLGKTISQEVQGTIAINVNTLQDVLRAIGPLTLPDYSETVTADNIFERAEYHAEVNFFPGSSQKKEFIGSVADAVLAELDAVEPEQALSLARALTKSIDEKNTLLAMSDPETNEVLSTLGWNGELRDIPCPDLGGACTADYAMLVDSNFGINKANYFVRRELSLDTTIHADRSVAHVLKAVYTNTSTSGAWPAGPYKSYSRLYLPAGSVVSSIKIGSKVLKSDEIKISSEHDKLIAGFLLEVPTSSTATVEIEYLLGDKLSETNPTYSWYWQKQSGTAADPLIVNVNYPLFLEPEIVSPQATLNTQQLQFSLSNITDRRITVKFK